MNQFNHSNKSCWSSQQKLRDERLGPTVDTCWFNRWLKIHSFYQIIITICRKLTIKDFYNQSQELHPETLLKQYDEWKSKKPNWTTGQICFRIIFWQLMFTWFLAFVSSGLGMGCTQTLSNITSYISKSNTSSQDQKYALYQGLYFSIMFIIRIYINEQSSRMSTMAAIKVQQIFCYKIYDKLTLISTTYKKHLNKGDLLTFFRVQIKHLYNCISSSSVLISAPTSLILSQVFIYIKLGNIGFILLPIIIFTLLIEIIITIRMADLTVNKQEYYQQRLANNINFYTQLDDIKALGWESVVINRNKLMRGRQNKLHFIYYFYINVYTSILFFAPSFIMLLYLLSQISSMKDLSSRRAYNLCSYLNQTVSHFLSLPTTLQYCIQAYRALQRLNNFFTAQQIQNHIDTSLNFGDIVIDNYIASLQSKPSLIHLLKRSHLTPYNSRSLFRLINKNVSNEYVESQANDPQFKYFNLLFKDICVKFRVQWKKGDRVIILAKDIFLANHILKCFLGTLKTQSGYLLFNGKIGYVKVQELSFLRDTIKNNIIFKSKQDRQRLDQIYTALDLWKDINVLQKGDDTIMDDSNLIFSLTIKKKIALARCIYANVDILLLDWFFQSIEPDSVDNFYNYYANHPLIFKNRTVIMTCKQTFYLKPDDKIVIMKRGCVQQYGIFKDLQSNYTSAIHNFTTRYLKKIATDYLLPDTHKIMKHMNVVFGTKDSPQNLLQIRKKQSYSSGQSETQRFLALNNNDQIFKVPQIQTYMQWKHYRTLITTGGPCLYIITIILNIAGQTLKIFSQWWIGIYSSSIIANSNALQFIVRYCYMIVGSTALLFVASIITSIISINNTEGLLDQVTKSITYCNIEAMSRVNKISMSYDFSKDNQEVFKLNSLIQIIFRNALLFVGTIIFMGVATWTVIVVGILLFIFNLIVMYFYRKAQMQIYKISIPLRSEYSLVLESIILRMKTIRTMQKTEQFRKLLMDKFYIRSAVINMNARFTSHGLNIIGSFITLFTIITMVYIGIYQKHTFSITQITIVSSAISMTNRLSRYMSSVTKDFSSFSKIANVTLKVIFDKLIKIFPIIQPSVELDVPLFYDNSIKVKNLYKKTEGNKIFTLNNINFQIPRNSRIALYGNINKDIEALFKILARVVKPYKQNQMKTLVEISNVNIKSVGSKQITHSVYILNDDPIIMSGTLRQNIDPLGEYHDRDIIDVLKQLNFWNDLTKSRYFSTQNNFGSIYFQIQEMGTQLLQRSIQKISLARAILRKPTIILYLNAFSKVSINVKDFLRNALYSHFSKNTTILMATLDIAQILRCDYLIGFHQGEIIQQGKPSQLIQSSQNRISQIIDIISQNQYEFIVQNKMQVYKSFAKAIKQLVNISNFKK